MPELVKKQVLHEPTAYTLMQIAFKCGFRRIMREFLKALFPNSFMAPMLLTVLNSTAVAIMIYSFYRHYGGNHEN